MSAKENPTYYRLELDDCSAAAFTSFGKYYYGTTEDFRCFFRELTIDMALKKQFGNLISRFQSFEEGQQNISHYIAYRKIFSLVHMMSWLLVERESAFLTWQQKPRISSVQKIQLSNAVHSTRGISSFGAASLI